MSRLWTVNSVDFSKLMEVMEREPDFLIGPKEDPYLRRWFLVPRNDHCNIYLHEIRHDDDDRALHDHPWDFESIVLRGSFIEHTTISSDREPFETIHRQGEIYGHRAEQPHRIQVLKGPVITLVITGPRRREWGFHCQNGWRSWQEFCDDRDSGMVGKGCD